MNDLALGIDIGATNTKIGLVNPDGKIIQFDQIPTPQSPPDTTISIINDTALELLDTEKLDVSCIIGVGVGFPGAIRQPEGIVEVAPNLRGWGKVELRKLFCEALGREIFVDNDANLAALAEYKWGAGKGEDPLILFTLGTGIGGGIIIDGKIFHGAWGGAAELGHQTVDLNGRRCKCNNIGCIEAIAGSHGIVARTWELLQKDKGSILWEMMNGNFDFLNAEMVGQAAEEGDVSAIKVAQETARAIGIAVANMINILNPQCILLAGGMTEWGKELLLEPIIEEARKRAFKSHFKSCRIAYATGGIQSGVLGAAALAFQKM